jgi:hypothetical protein
MLQKDKKWIPWRPVCGYNFFNKSNPFSHQADKIQLFSCPGIAIELAIISITR